MRRPPNGPFAAALVLVLVLAAGIGKPAAAAATAPELVAQADRLANADDGSLNSLRHAITLYEEAAALDPQNPHPFLRLADACLEMGELAENNGLSWYERGEQAAQRAVALKENSADAHFLLAANKGRLAEQLPFWKVSPAVPAELERHLLRALALDARHARALHMMGMLLSRVPGPLRLFMVGRKEQVEAYLKQAVAADPNSAQLHLSLAEFYRGAGHPVQAREHAQAALSLATSSEPQALAKKLRLEAEAFQKTLAGP